MECRDTASPWPESGVRGRHTLIGHTIISHTDAGRVIAPGRVFVPPVFYLLLLSLCRATVSSTDKAKLDLISQINAPARSQSCKSRHLALGRRSVLLSPRLLASIIFSLVSREKASYIPFSAASSACPCPFLLCAASCLRLFTSSHTC